MNIRHRILALHALAALCIPTTVFAQDRSAHAGQGQHPARTVDGTFVLRALNGSVLPFEFPGGAGPMIVGGTLELRLARPDSGLLAMRFASNTPLADGARLATEGRVQVRGDSLLFWPDGRESRPPELIRFAWTADRALDITDVQGTRWSYVRAVEADTAFAGVQSRGAGVMGVDQNTSTHVFESLPDGGRIVLQRDSADATGEATIRAHMRDIAERFSKGDFTLPGMVHAMPTVPGTAVMMARRAEIRYSVELLPLGAQLRIITRDGEAIKAIHEFLAFQRMDHRAMSHDPR